MNFLPLVAYEMRMSVRRPGAYRLRLAAGTAAIAVSWWGLLIWADSMTASSLGHSLLEIFGWTGFVGCALAGLLLTSDCISKERREGTLGLLLLTDLRGHDIAFGKLAAKGIAPLYCVLAMFPSLAVCMIVGGVTAGEVARLSLVLLNTLFFSLAVTMLTSTFCRQQRAAQVNALLAIFLAVPALPLLAATLAAPSGRSLWRSLSLLFSPAGNFMLSFDTPYRATSGWFWGSLIATNLLAWTCLAMTGQLLPRVSLEESFGVARDLNGRKNRCPSRVASRRQILRRELLSRNPIAWLAGRGELKQWLVWSLPVFALWIWLSFDSGSPTAPFARISFIALFAVHALFKLWVGADASHVFVSERLNGTLELLLATRLQTREVAIGMLSAFRRRFLGPLLVVLLLDAGLIAKLIFIFNAAGAFIVAAGAAMLVADVYCLCWVGLWRGLVARDPVRAILATIWRVLIMPWILFAGGVALFRQSTLPEFVGLWLVMGFAGDVVLVVNARSFFNEHFRAMALRPFGQKPPRVESKWSPMHWEEEPEVQANG